MSGIIPDTPTIGIGQLLRDTQLVVPSHQRDYKWDREKVTEFINDIEDARSDEGDYYFLGLMVFMHTTNDEFLVLDGQQRLATAVMLLSAIRCWMQENNRVKEAVRLKESFIGREKWGDDVVSP